MFICAKCGKKSYAKPQMYHGRQYGPDCFKRLQALITMLAARIDAVEQQCVACDWTFIAPRSHQGVCPACRS